MRVFLVAGEASGDKLGAALMAGLKELQPSVTFDGVGGPLMQAQGLSSRFPMEELSVMGIAEVLPKYRALKARIRETAQAVVDTQPDVLISVDSPDFSFRVAKLVRAQSKVRTVHYVAPTVWAWRPDRAAKIAQYIDHLLALFPFEPPYFTPHGMDCDFVGHPIASEPTAKEDDVAALRSRYGLGDAPIFLVLPGSRRGEVSRLQEVFGKALEQFLRKSPERKVLVPAAPGVADLVTQAVADWPVPAIVLDPNDAGVEEFEVLKRAAFGTADLALAASGTVSLELAAADTPMVIAYRMHWLTARIIGAMLRIDTVTLVNLVSNTRVVPEYLGAACTPEQISNALIEVSGAPQPQLDAMRVTMERLGRGQTPAGLRAAQAVLNRMNT
ncbi:MAG: lipid-A-disaccharide synthase [Pseudomonadota bacterium]